MFMPSGIYLGNKGRIPWNKGLTKYTDIRVKNIGIATSIGKMGTTYSIEHRENMRKSAKRGIDHHNWKGGITSKIENRCHTIRWKRLRKKVYERDNWTCRNCGKKCNGRVRIQCHHITAERLGGLDTMSNLITLCLSCHSIADDLQRKGRQAKFIKAQKI